MYWGLCTRTGVKGSMNDGTTGISKLKSYDGFNQTIFGTFHHSYFNLDIYTKNVLSGREVIHWSVKHCPIFSCPTSLCQRPFSSASSPDFSTKTPHARHPTPTTPDSYRRFGCTMTRQKCAHMITEMDQGTPNTANEPFRCPICHKEYNIRKCF